MKLSRIGAIFAEWMVCILAACSSAADPVAQTQTAIAQAQTNLQGTQAALVQQQAATQTAAVLQQTLAALPRPAHNADWIPVIQTFDGVDMVLVPAGCFDMGSANGASDEQPVNHQCFNTPFWIDRYEVTNAQFTAIHGQAGGASSNWTGDQRPREEINWFEARAYCALRGARLPTEAEWEYAARGPDDLVYPWGNDFVPDNVVYIGNSGGQTADVGSRTGGVSWVGALDMSGNVWEWVSSDFEDYPYTADDGREDVNRTDVSRVVRGGSWLNPSNSAASRGGRNPRERYSDFGVRCARSY